MRNPLYVGNFLAWMGFTVISGVLWFLPVASTAGIVIWKYFYSPKLGLLNGLITHLGLPAQRWLDDPSLAMISLVIQA